jgi:hypothetical protein
MELIKQMTQEDINFKAELEILINKHSQENKSNTPDFIKSGIKQKAEYFMSHKASVKRRKKNRKK